MNEKEEKLSLILITALVASQILHESLDDLQNTNFYKTSLKNSCKRFETQISKVCDNYINTIWEKDEEISRMVEEGILEISKKLSSLEPDKIAYIGELIKAVDKNKIEIKIIKDEK
jgi:ribosomal protein S20